MSSTLGFSLPDFNKIFQQFGLAKGIFTAFFAGAHYWLYHMYDQRVKDAKEQITRIAEENREYRERFLSLLDNKFGYKTKFNGPPSVLDKNKEEGGKK